MSALFNTMYIYSSHRGGAPMDPDSPAPKRAKPARPNAKPKKPAGGRSNGGEDDIDDPPVLPKKKAPKKKPTPTPAKKKPAPRAKKKPVPKAQPKKPTPRRPKQPRPAQPKIEEHCDEVALAAGFVGADHLPLCKEFTRIVNLCRQGRVGVEEAQFVREAFKTTNSNFSVSLWLGTLALTLCEYVTVLNSDMLGAKTARERCAPVLSARSITRLLTEIARRESFIKIASLNPDSGADGFWQILPSARAGNKELFAPWLPDWPDRRQHPEFKPDPEVQAQHCAVYLVRTMATLGVHVDFANGPVKIRGTEDEAQWKAKISKLGKEGNARVGSVTAEDLLIGAINGCWSVGCNDPWSDKLQRKNARMIYAVRNNVTWGQAK